MFAAIQIVLETRLATELHAVDTGTEEEALAILLPIMGQIEGQLRQFAKDRKRSKIDLKQANGEYAGKIEIIPDTE